MAAFIKNTLSNDAAKSGFKYFMSDLCNIILEFETTEA